MPLTKVKSGGVSDSITLTSPDINAPDIDGGTIDNAVIGGSTAAAGSFTTITATGGSSSNWNTAYGWGDHSTQSYATQTYVGTAVSNLVDSSPAALDTLNELAAALGDDPNFATTVTNSIALKAPLANPSFTGSVNTEAVSTNSLDLQAIAESKSVTAVDVFVYDTSKDSDGGAWRKRTQNTSWYNETLNTSTRGARKEFPAVAVIVATSAQVTIYDGDDPDMPMWMVFLNGIWSGYALTSNQTLTTIAAKNGGVATGSSPYGYKHINFISELGRFREKGYNHLLSGGVVNRNGGMTAALAPEGLAGELVNDTVTDIAITVLPNAPIGADTGLPVPTIAVATAGGVSVIKDDGTVVNFTGATNYEVTGLIQFTADNRLRFCMDSGNNRFLRTFNIPSADRVVNQWDGSYDDGLTAYLNYGSSGDIRIPNYINTIAENSLAGAWGFTRYEENLSDPTKSLAVEISSTYNTGYVVGQSVLATLSDTDDTNVTGSNLSAGNAASDDTNSLGDFSSQTGGTLSINTNASYVKVGSRSIRIIATQGASGGRYYKSNFLTVGKTYTISGFFNASNGSASNKVQFYLGGTDGASNYGSQDGFCSVANTWNSFSHTFTALTTHLSISFVEQGSGNATDFYVDGLEVRQAEPDRSVNGKGLQVFGTVTKTAVATGADLVGYSGFTSSNYLQQPYNSGLAYGTGDFSFICWVKKTGTAGGYIFDRANGDGTQRVTAYFNSGASSISGYTNNGPINDVVVPNGSWFQLVQLRVNGTMKIYINGELKGSVVTATNLSGDTNVPLRIGTRFNSTDALTVGSLALFRISATAPTAEQIAKMYNDEKHLFQENAKATLYGTSDAVTALAYDDDTELLHAGTSAGRSVFQGLRRVENTTDAVGSAISASNGLVAED